MTTFRTLMAVQKEKIDICTARCLRGQSNWAQNYQERDHARHWRF